MENGLERVKRMSKAVWGIAVVTGIQIVQDGLGRLIKTKCASATINKKDRRKGWPGLGRTHDALQRRAIRQKCHLCVRFKVIYCLAVATSSEL